MKLQQLYLDTSVLGGCFDPEFAEWSNGLIRDLQSGIYKPLLSQVIAAEIQAAPIQVQELYTELLALDPQFIDATTDSLELADAYQARKILTAKFYDDGLHIALATIAEADVLVSWNFKHIVRFDRIRLFNAVNLEFGS